MPQPVCFIDNKYYNTFDYPEIAVAFSDYPEIFQVNRNTFQFKMVGVLSANGQPVVVFPKNYTLDEEGALVADARMLARVILRYRSEGHHSKDEMKLLYGDSGMSSDRIAAAMFLLSDYCRNGFLSRQILTSSTSNNGRIDWSATINKTLPVFSNGNPLYLSPVMNKKKTDERNIVVLAHRYVISECFREWGWFFGYDDFKDHAHQLPCSVYETVIKLKKELRQIYQEREIYVIKNLIQYLECKLGNECENRIDVMGTRYFSFVWEAVCGYIMDNQYSRLKTLLPQPEWESEFVEGHISQRPDIFFVHGQGLYILDAKYYDYNKNLPGWHDVVKQFFYRYTLNSIANSRDFMRFLPNTQKICNGFVFPGNTEDCSYIGKVYVPRVTGLGTIKAFALNQRKALSAYAYRNDMQFVQRVRNEIVQNFLRN